MKKFLAILSFSILAIAGLFSISRRLPAEPSYGGSESFSWFNVNKFDGYQTRFDPTKISNGANAGGQNTTANNGDRISIRSQGYEIFPASSTLATSTPVDSLFTFRKRNGENVLMRGAGTNLEYLEVRSGLWESLSTTFANANFGFAEFNINTDNTSFVYFGNAVDNFSRWNGGHTTLTSTVTAGESNLDVFSTDSFASSGSVFYCERNIAYSSKTATRFILNGTAPINCANGRSVTQSIEGFPSLPKGNIYLAADNRLFISGSSTQPQAIYFSGMASSTDFTTSTISDQPGTATASGIFNLIEGGGGVTAMMLDENAIYIFKRTIIYRVPIEGTFYSVRPLKAFDGKSQTTGAVSQKSVFSGGNGIFFITPDNQIMYLARVDNLDYPQIQAISNPIKITTDGLNFASSTGIVYKEKAYISTKTNEDSTINDVVLVYNIVNQFWDSPITGWNASDFAIYDDDGEQLLLADEAAKNVFKVINEPTDGAFGITANWRSKQYDFGLPHGQKYLDNVFVEGYISLNTNLTISLLLDEDGYTQTFSTVFSGASSTFIYASNPFNIFGLSQFGYQRFGSNQDLSGKKKFRLYLGKDFRQIPFYNAQLDFASDNINQQWEVISYGFHFQPLPMGEKRELFKAFR